MVTWFNFFFRDYGKLQNVIEHISKLQESPNNEQEPCHNKCWSRNDRSRTNFQGCFSGVIPPSEGCFSDTRVGTGTSNFQNDRSRTKPQSNNSRAAVCAPHDASRSCSCFSFLISPSRFISEASHHSFSFSSERSARRNRGACVPEPQNYRQKKGKVYKTSKIK